MVKIQDFTAKSLKIDKMSYKHSSTYYIGYIIKRDSKYVNIHSVNSSHFIVNKVDGSIEEKLGSKYLNFALTDNNVELLKKYIELWDGIKNYIKKNKLGGECANDFIKVKFDSDDDLPLNKSLKFHNLTIIVRSVFEEDSKYYP